MLPDYLASDLRVVFCGTAAGRKSGEVGHYYAGRGNKFWRVLHEVGLTPRKLVPEEDQELLRFGIGLTDLAKGVSGMDRDLPLGSLVSDGLVETLRRWSPKNLAFNGKTAARTVFGKARVPDYGRFEFEGMPPVWVLPSTSGAASGFWSIDEWRKMASEV